MNEVGGKCREDALIEDLALWAPGWLVGAFAAANMEHGPTRLAVFMPLLALAHVTLLLGQQARVVIWRVALVLTVMVIFPVVTVARISNLAEATGYAVTALAINGCAVWGYWLVSRKSASRWGLVLAEVGGALAGAVPGVFVAFLACLHLAALIHMGCDAL